MTNDTSPNNLPGKSLEIALQDSLDDLEDFILRMAYPTTNTPFKILSTGDSTNSGNNLPAKPTPLTLATTTITNSPFQPTIRRHRRV